MKRQWFRAPILAAGIVAAAAGIAWAGYESYLGYQVVRVQVDGKPVESPVPAILMEGSTMVPLRAVTEALGATVTWDESASSVRIDSQAGSVATVNGQSISRETLYRRLAEDGGQKALQDLIVDELVSQEARKAGVTVPAEAVQAELLKLKQRLGGEEQYQQALVQTQMPEAKLLRDIQMQLITRQILAPRIAEQVTPEAVADYYAQNESQLRYPELQVRASHILVKTEGEAKDVLDRLEKGESFAAVAKSVSIDPGSRDRGGDLGFFGLGAMVPEFEQAALALKVGERSGLVKSSFGYHIIEVTDRKEGLVRTPEEAQAAARQVLSGAALQDLVNPWLQELRAHAVITNSLAGSK
jgi:foldase protein PrsA